MTALLSLLHGTRSPVELCRQHGISDADATSRPRLDGATALHASGAVALLITGAVLLAGY